MLSGIIIHWKDERTFQVKTNMEHFEGISSDFFKVQISLPCKSSSQANYGSGTQTKKFLDNNLARPRLFELIII